MPKLIIISANRTGLINSAFAHDDLFDIDWRDPGDWSDLAELTPDVIILETGSSVVATDLISSARNWPFPPAIISVGDIALQDMRSLIGYPRALALNETAYPDDLYDQVMELLTDRNGLPAPARSGQCWAVTGAVGGAGASLISIEMAYQLSRRLGEGKKVCLLDLNFEDGSLATYLDISPSLDLSVLCNAPDRLDARRAPAPPSASRGTCRAAG